MQHYLNGPTVTCKYSADFRGLVYKVNPHDLSCMYKRMFELCATNTLRELEATEHLKIVTSDVGIFENPLAIQLESEKTPVGKTPTGRLSRFASGSFSSQSLLTSDTHVQTKHINGWETCPRPHSALSSKDPRNNGTDGLKKEIRSRSQSALGKLECGKDDRNRNYSTHCRKASSSEVIASKLAEVAPSVVPSHVTCTYGYTYSHIPFRFKHYDDIEDYMDQYRECYTYKRLETMRPNLNEMRPCQLSLPVSPLLRCFDMFGCVQPPPGVPRVSISRLQAATSGTSSPKKQIKKKIIKSTSPDFKSHRQTSSILAAENGVLRMEFQGQPIPQVITSSIPAKSRKSSTSVFSDPCLTSVAINNIKIPVVCRTRPTIPSNAHGAIYASSTDTPTYVVSYHKNK